ncbi:hypothetical protein ACFLR7_05670 [Acidobacteriota bacterium]
MITVLSTPSVLRGRGITQVVEKKVAALMISSWNQDTEKIIAEIVNISKFKELAPGNQQTENQQNHLKASIPSHPYLYSNTKERDKQ